MNFKALIAAGALLATQSFAIIGIGGHYAPGFGNKMTGMDNPADVTNDGKIQIQHDGFKGTMQGFGFKLWIDLLPIIDVEATMNIQFGSYDATLYVDNPADGKQIEVPLEIELGGTPFGKANPKFVAMRGDLSITYPITTLPIIRPYIGGGITYNLNTFILNQKFTSSLIGGAVGDMVNEYAGFLQENAEKLTAKDPETMQLAKEKANNMGEVMKNQVQKAALDEGLNTSIGGHILVGARFKLPIIPIAAYVNGKFYFGGDYPSEIDPGIVTLEAGVGFAL